METKKKRKKLYRKSIEKNFKKKTIQIRVSEDEFLIIKEKAKNADLNISEFLRTKAIRADGAAFNPANLIKHFFNYTGAVNKVGVNINQATNYLNHLKKEGKGSEKELVEFNELFHKLVLLMTDLSSIMRKDLKKLRR